MQCLHGASVYHRYKHVSHCSRQTTCLHRPPHSFAHVTHNMTHHIKCIKNTIYTPLPHPSPVLYFKEDFEGRLWLLFCTGFSLEGPGKGVEAPDRPLSVRTSKLSTQIKNEVKPLTTHGAFLCCHCGRVKEYDSKTSIDFYTLISEYESKVRGCLMLTVIKCGI